jgi:hypothetical protein
MNGERAEGRSIPRQAIDPRFLRYDEAGKLGSRVEAFFAAVGRERCHVILFDDLKADARSTYRRMCQFLGVEPWEGTDFAPQRTNKTIRIGWLQRLMKRPPKPIRTALAGEMYRRREKKIGSTDGRVLTAIFAIRKRLLEWNKVPAKRAPLDPKVRQQIIDQLRDEVILLARVIDRDLSHWLGGIPEAKPGAKAA